MRSLVKILAAVLVMGPALSCSRSELDRLATRGEGMLSIACGLDREVIAVTRAEGEETVLQVTVTEAETGKVVASVDDHRTLTGSPLVLKAGQYEVRAFAGTGAVAAFDAPYYEGTATVDVVAGLHPGQCQGDGFPLGDYQEQFLGFLSDGLQRPGGRDAGVQGRDPLQGGLFPLLRHPHMGTFPDQQ